MDEGYEVIPEENDEVSQRGLALIEMAKAVDDTKDPRAKQILLKAMDAILRTISPPMGQLKVIDGKLPRTRSL